MVICICRGIWKRSTVDSPVPGSLLYSPFKSVLTFHSISFNQHPHFHHLPGHLIRLSTFLFSLLLLLLLFYRSLCCAFKPFTPPGPWVSFRLIGWLAARPSIPISSSLLSPLTSLNQPTLTTGDNNWLELAQLLHLAWLMISPKRPAPFLPHSRCAVLFTLQCLPIASKCHIIHG